jgi:hypothetical protein
MIVATPLARGILLASNATIGLNLSLLLVDDAIDHNDLLAWTLHSATRDVVMAPQSSSEYTLPNAAAPVFLQSFVRTSRVTASFVCVLDAPAPGWLPADVSPFRDVTLVLRIVLRCPADQTQRRDFVIEVPCPGYRTLASAVSVGATASQFTASFAGPAAGGAVGRAVATGGLLACSADTLVPGMLPLSIVWCGEADLATNLAFLRPLCTRCC